METLAIALLSGIGFMIAYWTYGRWLGHKIFELSSGVVCPSVELQDDVDFVPTPKSIVFGHHFTSIAGTGPIVGPAIAVLWGWLPALLWVLAGSVFIGAVHDLGSLVVSLRNRGQTVGEVAGKLVNQRVRLLFLLVLALSLAIVLAIFGLVIAAVFRQFPSSIFPCLVQIPIAIAIGGLIHRRGRGLLLPSVVALALMYASVVFGDAGLLHDFNAALAAWPTWLWVVFLLAYCYVASVLPVWLLLQPRDYINSLQLVSSLGMVVIGLGVAAFIGGAPDASGVRAPLEIVAPVVAWNPEGAPAIFPFLFITIACGAISGFHCLVSSGTSSKQLCKETDARFVGYGSMLTEGFLAVVVILACVAGIGLGFTTKEGVWMSGQDAWQHIYASWSAASGLGAKVGAFVTGASNFLSALGLSSHVAVALMGVLVASFAGTTLDSACRLQRYVIQELAATMSQAGQESGNHHLRKQTVLSSIFLFLGGRHPATFLAVITALALAVLPAPGREWSLASAGSGGLILWPLFGATNQLLGGLAFLVIFFYLWRHGKPVWFMTPPAILMLVVPLWAMMVQIFVGSNEEASWLAQRNWPLVAIGCATIALEIWMLIEAAATLPRVARGSSGRLTIANAEMRGG